MFGIFYWCTSAILSIFPSYMQIVKLKISVTKKATIKCSCFPCMCGRVQNMDPQSMDYPCGPSPWTPSWTQSMDYPCGPPYSLKMNFTSWVEYDMNNNVSQGGYYPQKQTLLSVYIIRLMSFSYYTPVQFSLEFHTWIRCSLVKDEQYLWFGGSSLLCKRFISSRCISSPEFPSVDDPWKCFFICRLKSLLRTDQAQNGLHIAVMSRKLAKCLSNNLV